MKAEDILVENKYQCESPLLSDVFTGEVITKLDNSCIVSIVKTTSKDKTVAKELQNKIVVSYKDIKHAPKK